MVTINASLLPVIALPFGSSETTQTIQTGKTLTNKKTVVSTWLVFCNKTPDTAYVLESENSNDIIVPTLSELVNKPKITISGLKNWEVSLSAKTLLKITEFFSDPLSEIDGITPMTLLNSGMITKETFLSVIKGYLSVALYGKTLEKDSNDKLLEFTYQCASYKAGLTHNPDTLSDKVNKYLTANKKPTLEPPTVAVQATVIDNETVTPETTAPRNGKVPNGSK